jgi:PAS domain S-box-containing protein
LDKRLQKINKVLIDYSRGKFDSRVRISGKGDETDAVVWGINALGEELKATTISRNYFNNILNSVSDMIFVVNNNGLIGSINRSVTDQLGYGEKILNEPVDHLLYDKRISLFAAIKSKMKSNEPYLEKEFVFRSAHKLAMPVRCHTTFLYNERSRRIGYLLTARDLTSIKKYEQSLRQSEERYRRLFEQSSDCIFIADSEGNFLDLNLAGYHLFKTGISDAGFNLYNMLCVPAERRRFISTLKQQKQVVNFPARLRCLDNSIAECLISANLAGESDENPGGCQGIIKDITQQKETENRIIRTIVDTQEKERIRFAKDIHDSLGQQLSAIKFYIGSAVNITAEGKQKEILLKSNEALVRVLADMRNICFNLMPKTLETFGLPQALHELCNQTELLNHLTIHLHAHSDFPQLAKSLEIAIFRIVQEFINNALKHAHASHIDITLRHRKRQARIILKDNGSGFDMQNAKKNGGMGLKNMQSRIKSYKGDIKINSVPGQGTTFDILIPVEQEPQITNTEPVL